MNARQFLQWKKQALVGTVNLASIFAVNFYLFIFFNFFFGNKRSVKIDKLDVINVLVGGLSKIACVICGFIVRLYF